MGIWEIEYWHSSEKDAAHDSSVEVWLDSLTDEQFKSVEVYEDQKFSNVFRKKT